MNHYTELLYYIKKLADADDLVNTVTKGDFDKLDLDKMNLMPLVHVSIGNAGFTNGSTVKFDLQVGAFNVRDVNKEVRTDKFWLQDNEVDNLNEMLAVLNRLWTNMYTDFAENDITASADPSLEQYHNGHNSLDGWILTFSVEMPNTTLNLCS